MPGLTLQKVEFYIELFLRLLEKLARVDTLQSVLVSFDAFLTGIHYDSTVNP